MRLEAFACEARHYAQPGMPQQEAGVMSKAWCGRHSQIGAFCDPVDV